MFLITALGAIFLWLLIGTLVTIPFYWMWGDSFMSEDKYAKEKFILIWPFTLILLTTNTANYVIENIVRMWLLREAELLEDPNAKSKSIFNLFGTSGLTDGGYKKDRDLADACKGDYVNDKDNWVMTSFEKRLVALSEAYNKH